MNNIKIHNFRELKVWQKSICMVKNIYVSTATFPKSETYGIVAQIQRAAVSIPANISEGCGRNSDKEFSRFLDIALGSAFELFTLITLSVELNFIDKIESESILHEISEIQKMIYGLKQKLNNK